MDIRNQDLMELVNRAKEEIEKVKKNSVENKKAVDEINNLIENLKEIKNALAPKQKYLKERIDSLNLILEEVSEIKSDIILSKEYEMFKVIDKNLLDGMSLDLVEDKENKKRIEYNGKDVGSIEILAECRPDIKIRVNVYNNSDEFIVSDPLKMYSIISFINTNFNYK